MRANVVEAHRRDAEGAADHWWFAGRRRIIDRLLDRWIHLPDGARLLDLGPGYGVHTAALSNRGTLVALDLDTESLLACRARGAHHLVTADATAPPFIADSFDLVTALDVLEHLDDYVSALRECHRVLKPGGHLLLTVPALRLLWGRQDIVAEHRRRYTKNQLATIVETAGFEVRRLSYFNFFLFAPVLLVRLLMRPFSSRTAVRSDFDVPAPLGLNHVLTRVFAAEGRILQRFNLPIGVSLICLARPRAGAMSQM